MSTSSDVSLGSLRLQARQRADIENNNFISDAELNNYISQSYKELVDKLISAYGNDYFFATNYQFVLTGSSSYLLPDGTPSFLDANNNQAQKFYKLLGVDLQYSASPTGWVTLRRYEFIDRNKYGFPNTAINWNGYSNLRYRLEGNSLYLVPAPTAGQSARIWYIPAPTSLQFNLPSVVALSGSIASVSDTTGLSIGMNAYSSQYLPANTTILSLSSNSVTLSSNPLGTSRSAILSFWNDSTTFDGISGWEEYVVIDAAIKCKVKSEEDISGLASQLQKISERIDSMAEGRDAGQAQHVSDALGAQSLGWAGYGMGAWGDGGDY